MKIDRKATEVTNINFVVRFVFGMLEWRVPLKNEYVQKTFFFNNLLRSKSKPKLFETEEGDTFL